MRGYPLPSGQTHRYGYNEWYGDAGTGLSGVGNSYDYGFRIYNPRYARFLSVDPVAGNYPEISSYLYAFNSPISLVDIDGLFGGVPIHSHVNSNDLGAPESGGGRSTPESEKEVERYQQARIARGHKPETQGKPL